MELPLMSLRMTVLSFVTATLIYAPAGYACTIFAISECREGILIKNYEWGPRLGYFFYNDTGFNKFAYSDTRFTPVKHWQSRYASITFSSLGRNFAEGGINERGLIVESAFVPERPSSRSSDLPAINEFEWVQLLLDRAADLDEAVEQASSVQIAPLGETFHYMVCDRRKLCAVFDYTSGRLRIHGYSADGLFSQALTNSSYPTAVNFLREHSGFGGANRIPQGKGSLERFVQASFFAKEYPQRPNGWSTLQYGFSSADYLATATTKWQVMYFNDGDPVIYTKKHNTNEYERVSFNGFLARTCRDPLLFRRFYPIADRPNSGFVTDDQEVTLQLLAEAGRTLPWLRSARVQRNMAKHAYAFTCQ